MLKHKSDNVGLWLGLFSVSTSSKTAAVDFEDL
jgi:hypothetical protein